MQNDDVIWKVINDHFCSFKVKTIANENVFCRNEFNVTGLCNRSSCPLANSQYATVKEVDGICYLYTKTVERAHQPSRLWERLRLSRDYAKALEQIDRELQFWPEFLQVKCKQRLTKISSYLANMRDIEAQADLADEMVPRKKAFERRERTREAKAEIAAKIENVVEREILERLRQGTYDGIYNFNQRAFDRVLQANETEEQKKSLEQFDADEEADEELMEEEAEGDDLPFEVDEDDFFEEADEEEAEEEEIAELEKEIEYEQEIEDLGAVASKSTQKNDSHKKGKQSKRF